MTPVVDHRNTNALWASVMVETLVRSGVHRAVVSPGSRSTPLAIALAGNAGIEAIPVVDERSAAFFALGMAKQDLTPVLLVCTSGTAGANYYPAMVEAHESGVPLLVLTADRPPEMRACASGQTIDQQNLFGRYANFFHELAVPELDRSRFAYLRQTVRHAVERTCVPQHGPVHLNIPFRDPLPPLPDGGSAEEFSRGINWAEFFALPSLLAPVVAETPGATFTRDVHGLIVIGPAQPADPVQFCRSVGLLARRLGWPVIADGLGPVRNHAAEFSQLVTTYDVILRNEGAAERLKPDVVLCVGEWPTSKVLRAWLEAADAKTWMVSERADNRDSLHGRTQIARANLQALAAGLPDDTEVGGYAQMWMRYERQSRAALDARLNSTTAMIEPKAAWLLAQRLPVGTPLFIANSMPIRDVEYVWPAGDRSIVPRCNRGANGIDGTLSTAIGMAHRSGRPSVLLTGDLALLHDTNGFLLRQHLRTSLTVVLINNAGGGIFEHLPVSEFDPPFEKFFATPQAVDFGKLSSAYGCDYELIRDWDHFIDRISCSAPAGIRILEVRTDRKRDAATRKQWFSEIAANLK